MVWGRYTDSSFTHFNKNTYELQTWKNSSSKDENLIKIYPAVSNYMSFHVLGKLVDFDVVEIKRFPMTTYGISLK